MRRGLRATAVLGCPRLSVSSSSLTASLIVGLGLDLCRRAPDESDDRHHDSAPNTTAEDTGDQRSYIETSCSGGSAKRLKNRGADSAPKNAGDRVPDCSQALVFEKSCGYVAPDDAANEIDNETDDIHKTTSFS